jgi:ribosomal protein S27E
MPSLERNHCIPQLVSTKAGPVDVISLSPAGPAFSIMQPDTQLNKMAGKRPTELTGERSAAEELVRCSCGTLVAVPYAGAVTCPNCRHETRWLSRYDHSKRRSQPIEPVHR